MVLLYICIDFNLKNCLCKCIIMELSESFKTIDSGSSDDITASSENSHDKKSPVDCAGSAMGPLEIPARIPAFGTVGTTSSCPTIGAGLGQRGAKSAFSPYKPTTILTNLQRGNIQTEFPAVLLERTVHNLAAQGELFSQHLEEDISCINKQDKDGFTPLMWACAYGQLPTTQLLLRRGAKADTVGNNGEAPIHFAATNGHTHIIKELLKHDVDVDQQDEDGNTALMYAAYNNQVMCAHELLVAGANFATLNQYDEMAYDVAITQGSKQVQALLEKHIMNLLSA